MFDVSRHDGRLPNKAEVLVLRDSAGAAADASPVAVSARFLAERPVFHLAVAGRELVVLTDGSGANRVYATGGRRFDAVIDDDRVVGVDGGVWRIEETGLIAAGESGPILRRVAAHRAFWFGWYAQYPGTQLID